MSLLFSFRSSEICGGEAAELTRFLSASHQNDRVWHSVDLDSEGWSGMQPGQTQGENDGVAVWSFTGPVTV